MELSVREMKLDEVTNGGVSGPSSSTTLFAKITAQVYLNEYGLNVHSGQNDSVLP